MSDTVEPVAPADAGGGALPGARSPLADGEWHRMHPLSPVLRGGLFLLVVIGIVLANLRERLIYLFAPVFMPDAGDIEDDFSGDPVDWVIANNQYLLVGLAVLVVLIGVVAWSWVSWRFHTFRITGESVEVRRGILFRSNRRTPLDRVQGVNITRPFVARLFGMAKLEVVGAGQDSNVRLEYLSTVNAETVRADILRLASGKRLAARGAAAAHRGSLAATVSDGITGLIAGAEEPVAEPASVVHVPTGRVIGSRLLSGSMVAMVLFVVATIVGSIVGTPWLIFTLVPAILGFGAYLVRSTLKSLRYSLAPTPDGLRITSGLLTTVTEILPPGRVHAVEVMQPLLWRPFDWWSVRVNRISGRSMSDGQTDQFTSVLPVGTRQDVERVLALLLPGVDPTAWPGVLADGLGGAREGDPYTNTPPRARILRLLSWRRNGLLAGPDALLLRRGVVWRALVILPLARLQSIAVEQGPLDRALSVASLHAHTILGPVSGRLGAIDVRVAMEVFEGVSQAAIAAAGADRSHRWAEGADAADVVEAATLSAAAPFAAAEPAPPARHASGAAAEPRDGEGA